MGGAEADVRFWIAITVALISLGVNFGMYITRIKSNTARISKLEEKDAKRDGVLSDIKESIARIETHLVHLVKPTKQGEG